MMTEALFQRRLSAKAPIAAHRKKKTARCLIRAAQAAAIVVSTFAAAGRNIVRRPATAQARVVTAAAIMTIAKEMVRLMPENLSAIRQRIAVFRYVKMDTAA